MIMINGAELEAGASAEASNPNIIPAKVDKTRVM
jgi:hypothetical protein